VTEQEEIEALALLEIDGLPRAVRAQDAALKRAPVTVLACAPVTPGKVILVLAGGVAAVEESLAEAEEIVGSRRLDRLFLPGVHPQVVRAMRGDRAPRHDQSLALLELATAAAAIASADAAVKAARVQLGRLHLAAGFGGRGYYTLCGSQADVEAAMEAALACAGDRVLDQEIIAAPHDEIDEAAFFRPWAGDPAADAEIDEHGE
jgi:microcompartment protein CcmL/EutN